MLAYAYYQDRNYAKAKEVYLKLINLSNNEDKDIVYNLVCTHLMLGEIREAESLAKSLPNSPGLTRLLLMIAHRNRDETKLLSHVRHLTDSAEDQLCLAYVQYSKGHYQEAIDIYRKILSENPKFSAVNIYIAICHFKLESYEQSLESLLAYSRQYPDSLSAEILHSCILLKLNDGKIAESHLDRFMERVPAHISFSDSMMKHNRIVYQKGERALQILPKLVDVIPEAKLNLSLCCLENESFDLALDIMKEFEPSTCSEMIVKAVVLAAVGQRNHDKKLIEDAKILFHTVGSDSSECDTIPGRLSLASSLILNQQVDDALVYLGSVKAYLMNDDSFNYNYGQLKAQKDDWLEAEEHLTRVKNTRIRSSIDFIKLLARTYIKNKKSESAWELFLDMTTSAESFELLQLISSACFEDAEYLMSAKAFDYLEKLDDDPYFKQGKLASCVRAFEQCVSGEIDEEHGTQEILSLLRNSAYQDQDFVECEDLIKRWAKQNGVNIY